MHLNVSFALLLLVIAAIQAGPTSKTVEKKTLTENAKEESKEENLKIEETGDDKERSKKAAVCLDLGAGYSQQGQVSVSENQLSVHSIPLTVQAQTIPQQVLAQPALSFVQPQASLLYQQPMVQPIQTLQIMPSQPCSHTAAFNIIHTSAQLNPPAPTPAPENEPEVVTEPPRPARIEEVPQPLPAPQESYALIPAAPCEQVMLVPRPEPVSIVQVSQGPGPVPCTNPLHRLTECTCHKVEPTGAALMSFVPYVSTAMMPRNMVPHHAGAGSVVNMGPAMNGAMNAGPNARSKTFVSVNPQVPALYPPQMQQQQMYEKVHVQGYGQEVEGVVDKTYTTGGVAVGGFPQAGFPIGGYPQAGIGIGGYPPQLYRSAGTMQAAPSMPTNSMRGRNYYQENRSNPETYNRFQSVKVPREVDAEQLAPEKMDASEQQQSAMLIDGRRNARSNKEEAQAALEKETAKN